jgi:hypothetical protein
METFLFVKSYYGRNQAKGKNQCKRCREKVEEDLNIIGIKNR